MRKARISAPCAGARVSSFAFAALLLTPTSVWAQEGAPPTGAEEVDEQVPTNPSTEDSPTLDAGDEAAESEDSIPDVEQPESAVEGAETATPPPETTNAPADGGQGVGGAAQGGATLPGSMSSSAFGAYPNPANAPLEQKSTTKKAEKTQSDSERIFAEQWWAHTRPTIELHGNFRVRPQLYHNFSLNRFDSPESALWPRPIDDYYQPVGGGGDYYGAEQCTPKEAKISGNDSDDPADATEPCISKTQAGANMRFRLEPTIVISDNLRVSSQIDMLGNLVMGSTAQGSTNFPAATGGGYAVSEGSGYRPVSAMTSSAASPVGGINSLQDAITINRAWAEYETPFGELKFGRMADNWGLGILRNAGDDIDGDQQSTVDRIAFFTGLPAHGLYVGGAWDYMDEGPISAGFTPAGAQAYDLSQHDDLSRMNLMLFRRMDEQLERLALAKGKVVVNGGVYVTYQYQRLANDMSGITATCGSGADAIGCQPGEAAEGILRRGFKMITPDLYAEIKYKKFYAGFEVVTNQGKFESLATGSASDPPNNDEGWRINQWGFAAEIEQRLVEDKLKLGFYTGWSSGDGSVNSLIPADNLEQEQIDDNKISTFRFHPGYRIDLILNRSLLGTVQGSYYFKPAAEYDFIRKANGMKLGGRAEAIWTRASNFMQTPGHHRDLGIELDGTVYYQSQDGVQNDREGLTGGFYSMLQYGVLFPLSGLGYLEDQDVTIPEDGDDKSVKLKPAQTVRAFLGVAF